MITCSRCGKDNQDHYKFCLGCGAKLEAAQAAGLGSSAPASAPGLAAQRAGGGEASAEPKGASAEGAAATAGAPDAAGGGMMSAAGMITSPSTLKTNAFTGGASAQTAPSPASGAFPAITQASASGAPLPGMTSSPAAQPSPRPGASPAVDTMPCPKCGKPVVSSYAFCGACGYRMKPVAGTGPSSSPGVPAVGAAAAARAPVAAPVAARTTPRGHLTLIRPDGTEGGVHPLHEGENLIGRGQGSLFDADPYLSPRHAEFSLTDEGLVVRDLKSLNGVFVKILQEERLESGDVFRIGQELLRFDVISAPQPLEDGTEVIGTPNPGYWGRLSVIVGRDVDGPAFPLFDEAIVLGRERGDILFPEDGYVSGTHAQITLRGGEVFLSDMGSSNGTFFRIRGTRVVAPGTLLLMGQQLFRAAFR